MTYGMTKFSLAPAPDTHKAARTEADPRRGLLRARTRGNGGCSGRECGEAEHPPDRGPLRHPGHRLKRPERQRAGRLRSTRVMDGRAGRHHDRLASEHLLPALVRADGPEANAIPLPIDLDHLDAGRDRIARLHRLQEPEILRQVDRPGTG